MMHPCAFYSRCLSPAERNYDVGNRELLALVLALQEWRHWLQGASEHFQDRPKKLSFLRGAKKLNSRQAWWALLFTRFNFTLTYRPSSKNAKPDALSCQFAPDPAPRDPNPIFSPTCIIGAVGGEMH